MVTWRSLLLALWLILMTEADLLLTQVALAAGTARELDPIVIFLLDQHAYPVYILYRIVVTGAAIVLLGAMKRSGWPRQRRAMAVNAVLFLWTAPVLWNLGVLGVEHVHHLYQSGVRLPL